MIATEILGNVFEDEARYEGLHREHVSLPAARLASRIQRVSTDHGRELGVRLPKDAPDLRDGDVLHADSERIVVVRVESTDVIVIVPRTIGEALFAAHSLGNRHLPAQFFDLESDIGDWHGGEAMVCQYDHTVQRFLDHHGIPYERERRVMAAPFRHAEHTH